MTTQNDRLILNKDPQKFGIIAERQEDGIHSNIQQRLRHHSPDGFEIGYGGSGPADFALNIVEYILHRIGYKGPKGGKLWDGHRAFGLTMLIYQDFKWEFIATAPREGGTLAWNKVETWVRVRITAYETVEKAPQIEDL